MEKVYKVYWRDDDGNLARTDVTDVPDDQDHRRALWVFRNTVFKEQEKWFEVKRPAMIVVS